VNQSRYKTLIVDDDVQLRETLAEILRSQGYQTTSVGDANEAIEKASRQFFDIVLLDVRLPDMEGTRLLSRLQELIPTAIKIIITGHPSIKSAADSLNIGANSYLTKPLNPDELLKTISLKLEEREDKERTVGKRLTEWVKLRLRETQSSEFEGFLEKASAMLSSFSLSKTAAKIYIGLNALTVASASEIASLTKIRREEIYRILPELERRGLVTTKLSSPRRFVAVDPKTALSILTKKRINAMKEEARSLRQKKDELISQLEKTTVGLEEKSSIESFSQKDMMLTKLDSMIKRAKQEIKLACSYDQLQTMFRRNLRRATKPNQMHAHIIVDGPEQEANLAELDNVNTLEFLHAPPPQETKIELRRVTVLPFNLLMIDAGEAMWGGFQPTHAGQTTLWTNDTTQLDILKMAFENLWQQSRKINAQWARFYTTNDSLHEN